MPNLRKKDIQYMIRYSALCDNDKQHRKKIDEQEILFDKMSRQLIEMNNNVLRLQEKILELEDYFCKAKELRPSLYDERVIGLGYTPMFLTHSNKALEIEKFKRARKNKIEFAYNYGNLNAMILEKIIIDLEDEVVSLLEKEKENLEIIESLKSKGSESSENAISESENQSENDCHVVEKGCDNLENSKVIAPGMFKINVSQSVSPISAYKTSCASNKIVINIEKGCVSDSSAKMLSCNNSHHVDTRSAYACNDAMNVSCNSRLYASCDVNDLFVFDDVSIRKSQVSKMPFRKKPRDSLNVHSRSNSNKSLPRTVFRWLPKMQPLAEPVAKWIPKIVQICLWIIDSGCSKHMTGNRALLTNFVEKFLGTVRFGNNDFAVIAGYGDVVIGSMTIKKVYYVEGLGHNLFSVGQFCDKGLEVAFRKSTCFVRNEDGVDLLTGDRSSNLYTIALNEIASNSSACLLAKASSSQSWLWHQRLSHLNFATINNLVKNNLVRDFVVAYETSNNEIPLHEGEVFHEVSESFQEESSLSSLNDDVQQSSAEVMVPPTNTQSISNESVPNVNEASTSHNVFNERLEDAYFDASTTFHDPSNVHTFYQPYPHEKKWTKDHPLHKIISDPKLSVHTRGQIANSCLFACLLSIIEPDNVAEALKDAAWVNAMQDELDQFARLKVWRLVPRPEGKTIIKTKWIFKNKKDESSLVIRNKARLV
ncbi:integrase, catalytic region, zinc finger, CCHC-type containing protein, partial [Tanacetum coccineum]